LLLTGLSGCTAISNPVAQGVPVRLLPDEILPKTRETLETIPLALLRQSPPGIYRLAPGDVLGIYAEGVLPTTVDMQPQPPTPPVYFPAQITSLGRRLPPAVGYPFVVQNDGTVDLPQLGPVQVRGKTLAEAREMILKLYVEKKILQMNQPVLVSLMQPRQSRVMVFREEAGGFTAAGVGLIASSTKRGTGHLIDLPAHENDILTALAQTGGLPGLDAYDEVVVFKGGQHVPGLVPGLEAQPDPNHCLELAAGKVRVIKIPLRLPVGAPVPIRPEDVLLEDGDVVFLEARDKEVFYSTGLLPAGEFVIPRDRDLDVIEAISLVRGPLMNGAIGTNNLSGGLIEDGIGNPSPSLLVVLRRLPDGSVLPIRVDLSRALKDSRERILVQPGDVLLLQEKPYEAVARYVSKTLVNFAMSFEVFKSGTSRGIIDLWAPLRTTPTRVFSQFPVE
jgi:protein involved in polysaccharide export with SLBB domain